MGINPKTRQQVHDKYNGHCAYCGKEITIHEMQVDHIVPKVYKGMNEPGNLNPACVECNRYKSGYTIEEFRTNLNKLFNDIPATNLFKSATKMNLALQYRVFIALERWNGVFYYEKIKDIAAKAAANIISRQAIEAIKEYLSGSPYDYGEITGRSRVEEITKLRHILFWYLYTDLKLSKNEIGRKLGYVHATVIKGLQAAEARLSIYKDPAAVNFLIHLRANKLDYLTNLY